MENLLEQAITFIKAGHTEKGKQLLVDILKQNPSDEYAWLWMSRCVADVGQKKDCFEHVLKINPNNPNAIEGLRSLNNFSISSPQQISQTNTAYKKRSQDTLKLAELEKKLATWERYSQEQKQMEDDANRELHWAWIGIIIGIFLTPVLIGIIIIIAGLMAASTNRNKRDQARRNQSQALKSIEQIRQSMSQVRAELSLFQN